MRCEDLPGHPDFVALPALDGIVTELRYASADNFVGRDLYGRVDCAWLHREAADGLMQAARWLADAAPGHRLLVLDALRPHRVQIELWDFLAGTPMQMYVADPARGSIHSFGKAVDVTVLDPEGRELDMGTAFDDLSELSHPALEEGHLILGKITEAQIANRQLLRSAMTVGGFRGINSEWWHFDHGDRDEVRRRYLRIE
ncbi:M15 family metallopeptidase [Chitinimonas sp. BJYL2]|uniref:M15 family metallopeptidase n=1 Tax=Chitinimonas sp. BJYL2 TaxID=2976696 RepID=UPI0022B41575|nr:M15 family metallopeptidase [Chitinimonas sp. BJYL2]